MSRTYKDWSLHLLHEFWVKEGEVLEELRVDIDDDDLLRRGQIGGGGCELGVKVRNVFLMFLSNMSEFNDICVQELSRY